MYARSMTVREIQGHLLVIYGLDVSPDLISTVTDAVLETVGEWQKSAVGGELSARFFRRLAGQNPRRRACPEQGGVHCARRSGGWDEGYPGPLDRKYRRRQILAAGDERAENRGVNDVLIAIVDGLKGFPEAINAVFPQTIVQTCIVHLIRHSMDFASWKDRKSPRRRAEGDLSGEGC